MFHIENKQSFRMYQWNSFTEKWEYTRYFPSETSFTRYIASTLKINFADNNFAALPKSTLEDSANYTGNDIYAVRYCGERPENPDYFFRNTMFVDNDDRIIDIRNYYDQALKYLSVLRESLYKRPKWLRKLPAYRYRYDPVPYVHHISGGRGYGRRVHHWHNAYVKDHIPEYKKYVRHKGMVPDPWDSEPFPDFQKSWKKQSKCRHQWEKHLYHKKETVTYRQMKHEKDKENKAILKADPYEENEGHASC